MKTIGEKLQAIETWEDEVLAKMSNMTNKEIKQFDYAPYIQGYVDDVNELANALEEFYPLF